MEVKQLYRDTEHKMIAGVCAGIAEYLNVDVVVVRLAAVVFALGAGSGILMYLIAILIMPKKPIIPPNAPKA